MTSPISDVTLDVDARIEEKNACNQNQRSCTPNLKQCLEATERCTITEHGALQGNEVCEVTPAKGTISKKLSPRELGGKSAT